MRWLNTKELRTTISALFSVSTAPPPTPQQHAAAVDVIRQRMLALAAQVEAEHSAKLVRRIRFAATVDSLWYARADLMAQLARAQGELAAREQLQSLSALFSEVLPRGLRSRPNRLEPGYRSSRPGASGF